MFLSGCISETSNFNLVIKRNNDSLIKEIPNNYGNSYYIHAFYNLPQVIKIENLENGSISPQIRIWHKETFKDSINLLSIKKLNNKWTAEIGYIQLGHNNEHDSIISITPHLVFKEPKSGWSNLILRINKSNFLKLPDFHSIDNYHLHLDGEVVTVEISDKGYYRVISYPQPTTRNINEARKLIEMINYFEEEFNYKIL